MSASKEVWFTPGDFSPSWLLRVTGNDFEIVKKQDIWPGYEGAKELPIAPGDMEFLRSKHRERILWKAEHGYDGWKSADNSEANPPLPPQ